MRVAWPDRVEEELAASCLRVVDRSFLHGDVVVRRTDKIGQIGTVVGVQLLADIRFDAVNGGGDLVTLPRVDATRLDAPNPFIIGRYVTKGAMLGIVQNCMLEVTVAFGSNPFKPKALALLKKPAPSVYKPQLPNTEELHEDEVGNGIYFPGMRVKAKHTAWKRATWLQGKHDSASAAGDEGTVVAIKPVEVHVEWISGDPEVLEQQHESGAEAILNPSECVLLGLWEEARWQVGDHVMLNAAMRAEQLARVQAEQANAATGENQQEGAGAGSAPSAAASSSSAAKPAAAKGKKGKKVAAPPERDLANLFAFAGTIVRTWTSVRVQWQDGSFTSGFEPAVNFVAREHLLDNDFSPADFAVVSPSMRLVHVLRVDPQERMVLVKFLRKSLRQYEEGAYWEAPQDGDDEAIEDNRPYHVQAHERADPQGGNNPLVFSAPARAPESIDESDLIPEGHEQWVPVFDLTCNPHFEFQLGSVVQRIPGANDDAAAAGGALGVDARMGWAGQVYQIRDGLISVLWADQTTSTLEVDQLMIVEHDEDQYDDDEEEDEDEEEEDEDGEDAEDDDEEHEEGDEPFERVDAPLPEADQARSDMFPAEWSDPNHWKKANAAERAAPIGGAGSGASSSSGSVPEPSAPPMSGADAVAATFATLSLASSAVALASAPVPRLPVVNPAAARAGFSYSSFDVIETPEPSSGAGAAGAAASSPASSLLHHKFEHIPFAPVHAGAFSKRIRAEWTLLRKNLPPGIHVLGYESRMDLYKVLLVGVADTPYYCNLFQFDMVLPPDYPASPPTMHFHSRGHRMNPNLYLDGTVCLSLLGTWKAAQESQRWNAESNLLQLLVSLQGLVIGLSDPYYTEAGYDRQLGQAQACLNSHLYNETALLVSLAHLQSYVANPLGAFPFVDVVVEHALNKEVQTKLRELEQVASAWEDHKRAQIKQFATAEAAAAASAEASTSTDGGAASPSAEPGAPLGSANASLDETHLARVLSRFAIRAGGEVAPSASPAAPGGAGSSSAAAPAGGAVASVEAQVHYHPSLAFIAMLHRQSRTLVAALDRANENNMAGTAGPSS